MAIERQSHKFWELHMTTDTAKIRFNPLVALLALAPLAFIAQSQAAGDAGTATVTLADLNLTTPAGVDMARNRLHQAARQLCSEAVGEATSHGALFVACLNDTVTNALRQIDQPARAAIESGAWTVLPTDVPGVGMSTSNVQSDVMVISMPKAELATPEGARIAKQQIKKTAQHVCASLTAQENGLSSSYGHCVEEATTAALRQVPSPAMVAAQEAPKPRIEITTQVASK
jgi:UrcA family protein